MEIKISCKYKENYESVVNALIAEGYKVTVASVFTDDIKKPVRYDITFSSEKLIAK